MNLEDLKKSWKAEEDVAHIHGWDFSHIKGRYEEEQDLPWDYEPIVRKYLTPELALLDTDTGGGEFLLSLHHPHYKTSATEGYPPNIALCKKDLLPLGIDFREANDPRRLPFKDHSFDIIINRHGNFNAQELFRIMKPNGIFVTEQVGAENDRELVEWLVPGTEMPYPTQYLTPASIDFEYVGFEILMAQEAFRPIKFYDVGALVWFAHIIEWEFPGFSVDNCFAQLCKVQRILEEDGVIEGTIHRFLLIAKKAA